MERLLRKTLRGGRFVSVPPKRSALMGRIRGKGNRTTEVPLRLALVRSGIRGWKLHDSGLPGKPDFYFPSAGLAIFVDGCFWHGCAKCGHMPKTNAGFWTAKLLRNKQRRNLVKRDLKHLGIRVLSFWEHEICRDLGRVTKKVVDALEMRLGFGSENTNLK